MMRKAGLRMLVLLALLLPGLPALAGARQLEVYVRDGCPHCAAAERWLASQPVLQAQLQVHYLRVNADPAARDRLLALSKAAGYWPPGVPTFVLDGQILLVGFEDGAHSGTILLEQLGLAPAARTLDSATPALLPEGLSAERLGLPLFTLAIGLLDGFNPCAMWVLLFLLSLLVHLQDRRRMALIAGTFVLVSGALYYAFLAAWLNLFLLVGLSGLLLTALGVLAVLIGVLNLRDGLRRTGEFSLSIPAAHKPGLYARMRGILQARSLLPALAGVATLAVVVNFIELLCTAGLPALYTAVLARHELPLLAYHGYLALYILGYIADDSLMVACAVCALGSRRLSPAGGRLLKLLSGAVMLALGLVMLLQPQWLLQT